MSRREIFLLLSFAVEQSPFACPGAAAAQCCPLFLNERGEEGQAYTVFSDPQAAVARIQHGGCGPAQALARAVIDLTPDLRQRRNSITVRWTPAHLGVEESEHADAVAKRAAGRDEDRADWGRLASRTLRERLRRSTREWIRSHVRRERRYRPPPGGRLRKGLGGVRKELAGRFYQLLSGHAATGVHLR